MGLDKQGGEFPEQLRRDPLGDLDEAEEIRADLQLPRSEGAVPLRERARSWSDRVALEALTRAASSISSNLDLRSLVSQILDTAIQALGGDRGVLFLGREPDGDLVPAVARSIDGSDLPEVEQVSRTALRRAIAGASVQTGDALADPILKDSPSISLSRIRSVTSVPLVFRGHVRGVLYVDSRSAACVLPEAARTFIEAFASLAAVAIENAELHGEVLRENRRLQDRLHTLESFGRVVTVSPAMSAMLRQAHLLAQADAPLMILGESGTGKEILARAIHQAGPRAGHPFVAHNCAAVPGHLMESIFFGHVRGSFTGAVRDAQGLFRLSHRGVLFLDEIAELDLALQSKLLRVLEDGKIRPVGSDSEIEVDVRVFTATSRDLHGAVREGRFREDLFYRASVLEIQLPPLRERTEDIPVLVDHFVRKHAKAGSQAAALRFPPDVLAFMRGLPWRGNVRELENLVQRVLILCPGPVVAVEDIRRLLPRDPGSRPTEPRVAETTSKPQATPYNDPVAERHAILDALQKTAGNRSAAARLLGIHRNSLLRRMKRLQIAEDG